MAVSYTHLDVYKRQEEYILEGKDISSNEKIEKHAAWVQQFLPKYKDLNRDNIHEILQKEVGNVFVHVLEDAGVYKCTEEGRACLLYTSWEWPELRF